MDSPPLYDSILPHSYKGSKDPSCGVDGSSVPDLADLNSPEVSLDLHHFIQHHQESAVGGGPNPIFSDILSDEDKHRFLNPASFFAAAAGGMPQGSTLGDRYAAEASVLPPGIQVKQENGPSSQNGRTCAFATGPPQAAFPALLDPRNAARTNGGTAPGFLPADFAARLPHGTATSLKSAAGAHPSHPPKLKSKKSIDKSTEEYRRRRERNNIAVRKSREKAKQRSRDTEKRVAELLRENELLRKRIEQLSKELAVLKSLLNSYGIAPENMDFGTS